MMEWTNQRYFLYRLFFTGKQNVNAFWFRCQVLCALLIIFLKNNSFSEGLLNMIHLCRLTWMSSFNLCIILYVMNKVHNNLQRIRTNTDEKADARYSVVFKYIAFLCFSANFQTYLHILLWDQLQSFKCEKVICDE